MHFNIVFTIRGSLGEVLGETVERVSIHFSFSQTPTRDYITLCKQGKCFLLKYYYIETIVSIDSINWKLYLVKTSQDLLKILAM